VAEIVVATTGMVQGGVAVVWEVVGAMGDAEMCGGLSGIGWVVMEER
jgi:hypothetical protein